MMIQMDANHFLKVYPSERHDIIKGLKLQPEEYTAKLKLDSNSRSSKLAEVSEVSKKTVLTIHIALCCIIETLFEVPALY